MPTASGHTAAIRAKTVLGTAVYGRDGRKIGMIEDVVLDKTSNAIMFAAVGFGGFLGIGEKYHPIPWSMLDFDPALNGYVVSVSEEQLKAAPYDSIDRLTANDGHAYRDRAFEYYKARPYWNS